MKSSAQRFFLLALIWSVQLATILSSWALNLWCYRTNGTGCRERESEWGRDRERESGSHKFTPMPSAYRAQRNNLNAAIVVKIFSYAHRMHIDGITIVHLNGTNIALRNTRIFIYIFVSQSKNLFSRAQWENISFVRTECRAFTFDDDFCWPVKWQNRTFRIVFQHNWHFFCLFRAFVRVFLN